MNWIMVIFFLVALSINSHCNEVTSDTVKHDYDELTNLLASQQTIDTDDLAKKLIHMLNTRELVDRLNIMYMHASIPKDLAIYVFGEGATYDGMFQEYSIKDQNQGFTFSYDRETYQILTVAEIVLWKKDQLKKFIDENFKTIFMITVLLNHLKVEQLWMDTDDLERVYKDGKVNVEFIQNQFKVLAGIAKTYRNNFDLNVKSNLTIFGIPNHLWSMDYTSCLSLGTRDWFELMSDKFMKTSTLLAMNQDISETPDPILFYSYCIMFCRAQTYLTISTNIIDHVSKLYQKHLKELPKASNPSIWTLKSVEQDILELKKEQKQRTDELERLKKSLEKQAAKQATDNKQIKKAEGDLTKIQKNNQGLTQQLASLKETQRQSELASEDFKQEIATVLRDINAKSKKTMTLMTEIKRLEARENHSDLAAKVEIKLSEAQNQLALLQGVYKIYERDSDLLKLRSENEKIEAENADLDAEIARLEAQLKSE